MAAQGLAANGAKVYIVSRRGEALERAANAHDPETGGSIIACNPCDMTKKDELQKLVDEISSKEGRVDLLVTAAGRNGPRGKPDSEDANQIKSNLWNNESVSSHLKPLSCQSIFEPCRFPMRPIGVSHS